MRDPDAWRPGHPALLEMIGKVPSKHAGVISLFDTEFVLKGELQKDLSKDFHKAFELRQTSYYRILDPCTPEKAAETLSKAVAFVHAVTTYVETRSRAQSK
jgi:uncharacterized protein (UPF0332 family)